MSVTITTADPSAAFFWIAFIASAALSVYMGYKNGGLSGALKAAGNALSIATTGKEQAEKNFTTFVNLMSADVPFDDAQRELLASGLVSSSTWRMATADFNNMAKHISGVSIAELQETVTQAEASRQVDYGILIHKAEGVPDLNTEHVYVCYGIPQFGSYEFVVNRCSDNDAKAYVITPSTAE